MQLFIYYRPFLCFLLLSLFFLPCRIFSLVYSIFSSRTFCTQRSFILHSFTFSMSSPSTPVWHLRKLRYEAQDHHDLIQSIWRALAEVNDIVSQELARV